MVTRQRLEAAENHGATYVFRVTDLCIREVVDKRKYSSCFLQRDLARCRWRYTQPVMAMEELFSKYAFQVSDRSRDCRLRHAKLPCSLGNVIVLTDCDQVFELA